MATAVATSQVKLADNMSFLEDVPERLKSLYVSDAVIGKVNKNKILNINPKPGDRSRVTLISMHGGYIPEKFGVEHGQFGDTVKCNLSNDKEAKGALFIDEKVIAKLVTEQAWPEKVKKGEKIPSEESIRDTYVPFLHKGKPKDVNDPSKGYWNSWIKGKIIADNPADKKTKPTKIVDAEGHPVHIDTLPGKKYSKATWEVHTTYFMGKNIGCTVKLTYLRLAKNQSSTSVDPAYYDGLAELDYMSVEAAAPESVLPPLLEAAEPSAVPSDMPSDQTELLAMLNGGSKEPDSKRRKR